MDHILLIMASATLSNWEAIGMLRQFLKILLAAIVALLLPDDHPVPPPWYSESVEATPTLSLVFSVSSSKIVSPN